MKTSVTIPDDLFERLKVRMAEDGSSVSAILARGAEIMLGSNSAVAAPEPVRPARAPTIVTQSEFVGGQVDVTLSVPLAVMASTPLLKLSQVDKMRFIEDEMSQRFLYRKVARVK